MIVLDPALLEQVLCNIAEAAKRESQIERDRNVKWESIEQPQKFPVWLNVYDLSRAAGYVLNNKLSNFFGLGAFHCGIEVLGAEWSFQAPAERGADNDDRTGLMCHHAKVHPVHIYKESLFLGDSPLRVSDIWGSLLQLERQWLANSYHAVTNNCTDFAAAFAAELRVKETVPSWVHGIAKGYLSHTPLANVDADFLPQSCVSLSSVSDSTVSQRLTTRKLPRAESIMDPDGGSSASKDSAPASPKSTPSSRGQAPRGVFFLPLPGQEPLEIDNEPLVVAGSTAGANGKGIVVASAFPPAWSRKPESQDEKEKRRLRFWRPSVEEASTP